MAQFSADAWQGIEPVRAAIDRLPFLIGLRDGSLARERFAYYMTQDAIYLGAYSRVLASCAVQAADADEVAFWNTAAQAAIAVERVLHASHVVDPEVVEPSPTCLAYISYLGSLAGSGSYATLVAGVLPCFWIYQDVGARLHTELSRDAGHPYGDWIATYGDPDFAEATRQVRQLTDRAAHDAGAGTERSMRRAFGTAARYEYMFWDAAWRMETWPI